jgi:Protein of unknown function (DUF1616)
MASPEVLALELFRVIFGFALTLFIPGFAFTLALFPRREDISPVERLAFSFVLSISSVLIVVLFIDMALHIPTTAFNIAASLLSFTFLCFALFGIQFYNVPGRTLSFAFSRLLWVYAHFPSALRATLSTIKIERRVLKDVESKVDAREAYLDSIEKSAGPLRKFEIKEEEKVLDFIEEKADDYYTDLSKIKFELESIEHKAKSAKDSIRPKPKRLSASELVDRHLDEKKQKRRKNGASSA